MGKPSNRGFSRNVYTKGISEPDLFDIGEVEKELKPLLVSIIEKAFRRFMKAHNAPADMEEIEWMRFKKILNRML